MPRVFARNLARSWRLDPRRTLQDIQEALELGSHGKPGGLTYNDFSLRDLAEECIFDQHGDNVGYRFVKDMCNPGSSVGAMSLQEAFTAVDSTAFLGLSEQLLVRAVLDAFRNPAFVLSNLIRSVPTPFTEGELIPGMTLPRNPEKDREDALELNELEEYKVLGFGEEYIQMPATKKRGAIIALSREMIFRDRTGLAVRRAQYVGTILGLSKERRLTDVVIGAVNPYKEQRKGQTSLTSRNTYYSLADTSEPWVNHLDGNDLIDYTALDAAEELFQDMVDPNTGEPILITGRQLMYMPAKRSSVFRVLNATEVRDVTNTNTTTLFPNPIRPVSQAFESIWAYKRLQDKLGVSAADAQGYWFYGDMTNAFEYLENWPIEVSRQAPGADAEFWQDIVTAFKASERGVAAVIEPRRVVRCRSVVTSSSAS